MQNTQLFRKFGIITICAVYVLIAVGGIVRATGSGMGCPDWPRCFGRWIPPTDISQLPENYKEIFKVQGKEIADFSAIHTWTEYVNRLVGVAIGILIFGTFVLSLQYRKIDKPIVGLSFLSFLIVGFQGWLGSVVVATNLQPFMITLHMLLALFLVLLLIYIVTRSFRGVVTLPSVNKKALVSLNVALALCMIIVLVQIVIGTQVREEVDHISRALDGQYREDWLSEVGVVFSIHRAFAVLVLAFHGMLYLTLLKYVPRDSIMMKWNGAMVAILVVEAGSGIAMNTFAMPAFLQPIHLLLGTLLFGVQSVMLMIINYHTIFPSQDKFSKVMPESPITMEFS
jgi:cytochrome c oxidase assembly protein subunit 15